MDPNVRDASRTLRGRLQTLWSLVKETGSDWVADDASRLAAALAFYTLLSIAPLLVLLVSGLGLVYGDDAARGEIAGQLRGFVGPEASRGIEELIAHARSETDGMIGSIVGVTVLLFGASGVFGELQSSLDRIWEVEPKPGRGLVGVVKDRFFSFTMVLGVGFLLLVSLVISTTLAAVGAALAPELTEFAPIVSVVNLVVSFGSITVLFALMFKVIPDVRIAWSDVWIGAAVTALLFTIGKFLLGLYLGQAFVASPYGAAGSLVVLVIWVYYSAQILFLGAEFTQVYARRRGARLVPTDNAVVARDPCDDPAIAPRPGAPSPTPTATLSAPDAPR